MYRWRCSCYDCYALLFAGDSLQPVAQLVALEHVAGVAEETVGETVYFCTDCRSMFSSKMASDNHICIPRGKIVLCST
jgi:hypothetical protein